MQVIFIASLSHSGSTLLDLMLNAHPRIASVGELKQLGRFANFKKNSRHCCTCGAPTLWECPFWASVNDLARDATGLGLGDLNVETYSDVEGFARDNVVLFDAIAKAAGKQHIVDSSKNSKRLELLLNKTSLDVFTIFLVRDAKGQVCSTLRKAKSEVLPDVSDMVGKYVKTNLRIHSLIADRRHAVVAYEDLVRYPERTLDELLRELGLAFDPSQLHWAACERHNVGGNGMRRRAGSVLKLDERWKQALTPRQQLIIDKGALPVRELLSRPSDGGQPATAEPCGPGCPG